jgi:chromosome partitioning protein
MTKISFIHHKGGTGKTTSCVNISGYLAKEGKKVLVVDTDPLGGATSALGIDQKTLEYSMYDVMIGEKDIKHIILETEVGIHLAPSNLDLVGAEPYMYGMENRATVLKQALGGVEGLYDYIMIDTPPGPGLFLINGAVASDRLIAALDPGILALENIKTLNTILDDIDENTGIKIKPTMAILSRCNRPSMLSRLMGRRDPAREIEGELRKMFEKVFTIPYSVEVFEAQMKGLPISHWRPNCKAGLVYKKIAQEVMAV